MKRQKDLELRQQFFQQNGGGMLVQRLSGAGPSNVDVKIFTEAGMKTATDCYDESIIFGQIGTVYKGILPDDSIVVINEVLVLSQINHRNVVRLLGCCCLETKIPFLVYEFINSGTLFDHLHGSMYDSALTWEHRLRIAVEVAGTLAYLHSSASIPITHRDVKTANILLDINLTAKVADFGASRLIPTDGQENRLHEIIDGQVITEYNQKEILEAARIALQCTILVGEERPKMKEVAAELEALRVKTTKHQFLDQFQTETEHLLGFQILSVQGNTSSSDYDSIKNVARLEIQAGR